MAELPKIVVRGRRGDITERSDFSFTPDQIPQWGVDRVVRDYRVNAWDAYKSLDFPTTKEEAWRRTDLKGFDPHIYHLPGDNVYLDMQPAPEELLRPVTSESHGGQVLLLPGAAQTSLEKDYLERGIIFTDLRTAEEKYPEILRKILGRLVQPGESKFAALTGALAQQGVLLYIPPGVVVEQPLHSLLWGAGVNLAYISHILVYLDEGSSVTYVHESASPNDTKGQNVHMGIVEIFVGAEATLRFVELQSWGENMWNFTHERVNVDRDGNLDWIFGAIGSHLTKNFSELNLVGQGSTGKMSGFYFTNHDQHLDHDTQQNHLAMHTTSDLLFKGALLDESRSVWQGMIYVAPGADKTDGYQANRNLVLSPKARADSIPGLEILANDVRCTHGATVGKIDSEQIFYLLSRGIPEIDAKRLIVEGFFDPIMQRIPFEGVRQRFQEAIHKKMESFDINEEI